MPKRLIIILHIFFWVSKIGVSTYLFTIEQVTPETDLLFFSIHFGLEWSITIIWFYINYFYFVPQFLFKKKYLLFSLSSIGLCYFNFIFKSISWNDLNIEYMWWPRPDHFPLLLYNTLIYITISTTLKVFDFWVTSEKEKLELRKEVKSAELDYLKFQINPHFLFNTLNNIYGLSIKKNPAIVPAIDQLIQMVKYNDNSAGLQEITLKDEINQLTNFVQLNQLRYNVQILLNKQIDNWNINIPPMLLIPFIENTFKHGSTGEHAKIEINLTTTANQFKFSVGNEIDTSKRKDTAGGIGIVNIRKRLELIYPGKYDLKTQALENNYYVELTLMI